MIIIIFTYLMALALVAHNIYGLPSTLNCANLVYFMALEHCLKLDHNNNDNSMRATAVFIGASC